MVTFRPAPILSLASLVALAVLVMLGVWQLQRMDQKAAVFAQIAERLSDPPLEPAGVQDDPALEFRPVVATVVGGKSIALWGTGARTFQLGILGDRPVLIETAAGGASAPDGARIEGVLRRLVRDPETPPDEPNTPRFFAPGSALATALGGRSDPYWYVASRSLVTPRGAAIPNRHADPRASLPGPERHLGYAITWFGLAIGLVGVVLALHARLGRLKLRSS